MIVALTLAGIALMGIAMAATPPWEKKKSHAGEALYRENCIVCHDIDKPESKKLGPDFYQLFKREKMPLSNAKPSRAYIAVRVQFGGQLMPAFRTVLTKQQIDTLIDYIESR
jgi:mono/diheme cytochrome c family protein